MAQYKIIGLPNNQKKSKLNNSLLPVSKEVANVEAEKGETVVTNMSRGLNNIYEMYNINGKKHSKGGTPLALPTDEEGANGTSFIFSDSKKLIVKDPALLEYFGVSGKKPKTLAQISKKWIPAVNKAKEVLIDLGADRLSKQSAEMTLDNASFKIAALKLLQESMKGMNEVPNGLEPFFDKLQLDPSQVFGMDEEMANKTNEAAQKAMGGILAGSVKYQNEFPSLRKYTGGGPVAEGDLPDDAVKHQPGTKHELGQWYIIPEGEPNAGKYRKATKLSKLKTLKLEKNKLTTLPEGIGKFSSLIKLMLGGNRLGSLPAEIGNLSALRTLSLNNNNLTSLPSEIGRLKVIKKLKLSNNSLISIPPEIRNFKNLKWLDLSKNFYRAVICLFPQVIVKPSEQSNCFVIPCPAKVIGKP